MLNSITSTPPSELARQKTGSAVQSCPSNDEYAPVWMFENSSTGGVSDNLQTQSQTFSTQVSSSNNDNVPAESGSKFSDKCDDGEDDGRIGIGSAILHTLKGAGKAVVNTVKDIVTDPKKLVVAAATTVACTLCPPLAVGLGVVGAATGVYKGAKAVGKAVELYNDPNATDAEAKAAFQDIGASALQVGVSVVGAKAGMKAMKSTQGSAMSSVTKSSAKGAKGMLENGRNTLKAFAEDTVTGGRGFTKVDGKIKINTNNSGYKGTQIYTDVKNSVKTDGIVKSARTAASNAGAKVQQKWDASKAAKAAKASGAETPKAPSDNFIKKGAVNYSKFAKSANYTSGFGSLTAPAANEIKKANETSNYDKVQKTQASSSGYVSGQYEFSHDWMDKI